VTGDPSGWIWGWHAVAAALGNADREPPAKVLATAERAAQLKALHPGPPVQILDNGDIARFLPPGASHQGVAIQTPALEGVSLEALAEPASGFLLMLDQVTDPQNVGAIFRSAAAFGARGVILQDRHAPQLGGALAKAAAGAIEKVPAARVVNLARALDKLTDLGWLIVGLSGESDTSLEQALDGRPAVLVMGSEGEGMRRLVSEHCDVIASIPMPGGFESLNVSSAAAIALYEASRQVGARVTGERG
jgi:23S rRNA (guanosine2251-2'-O)-methyltransferase